MLRCAGCKPLAPRRACPCAPRNTNLAESASSLHDLAALRVRRYHCDYLLALDFAKEGFGNLEIAGHFDDGLHFFLVLHWTLFVKLKCLSWPMPHICSVPPHALKTGGAGTQPALV